MDERESRLPSVLREILHRVSSNESAKEVIGNLLDICENQAFGIFASCWFLRGTPEQERKMWEDPNFGGGNEGGIRINSRLSRLTSSLPTDVLRLFGVGRVQYIRADISYAEVFALGPYHSMPFLLKLENHTWQREIRLFERFARSQTYWDAQPEQPPCTRFMIDTNLIESIIISPICSKEIAQAMATELIGWRFPKERILSRY